MTSPLKVTKLTCLAPRPMAQQHLICLPHAGAGPSSFAPWKSHLSQNIQPFGLNLPGREALSNAPMLDQWESAITQTMAALEQLPHGKISLFGHSLGALMALDVARLLTKMGKPPAHLFVSGRPWPGQGIRPNEAIDFSAPLSDAAFLDKMAARYGPLPKALAHPEILAMAKPILEADLRLLQNYTYKAAPPLSCPLSVFTGKDDPITAQEDVSLWQQESKAKISHFSLDAGHYYIYICAQEICQAINAKLADA